MSQNFSDDELVKELVKRLKSKDLAYHDLMVVNKKLKVLNDRLVESEKVKSHFLSNIRNEINNPLTSVLTMCDLILSGGSPPDYESLRSAVTTIYREAFSLDFQLRNIFAAAELESGDAVLTVSNVDLRSLVKSVADAFGHRAVEKGVTVSLDLGGAEAEGNLFRTDPERLQSIVSNLLANAIEFSHEGGAVEIKAWRDGAMLFMSLIDHGIGIDGADHANIFERFRQLDTGVTKRHGGHGLGLSITKASLEILNGTVKVDSRRGEGAVFTVMIPESAEEPGAGTMSVDGNDFFFGEGTTGERF